MSVTSYSRHRLFGSEWWWWTILHGNDQPNHLRTDLPGLVFTGSQHSRLLWSSVLPRKCRWRYNHRELLSQSKFWWHLRASSVVLHDGCSSHERILWRAPMSRFATKIFWFKYKIIFRFCILSTLLYDHNIVIAEGWITVWCRPDARPLLEWIS